MVEATSKQVKPAGCGCGTSAQLSNSPVYVVGSIGFDFGTEARRDALYAANGGVPIFTGAALAAFLASHDNAPEAASIIWTLNDDQYPIYSIRPRDTYGADAYAALTKLLKDGVDRVSVPGWINGSARLMNGWVVPIIEPDVQGLRAWSTSNVVSSGGKSGASSATDSSVPSPETDLRNFMNRIYFELRNKGVSPQERASNFAATQAYFVNNVITYAVGHGLNLQNVNVSHSPLCRPGSECWDVMLTFFDPQNLTNEARKTFRFTIDVSDVKPVMIGPMYKFNSY